MGQEQSQLDILPTQSQESPEGIFSQLRKVFSGDLIKSGIVQIKASSTAWKVPDRLIDENWDQYWYSNDSPNSWIEIEFLACSVRLSAYELKTYHALYDGGHLQSWVLSGSTNGVDWITLDEHRRDSSLNGKLKTYRCPIIPSPPIRFIRLTQTERNTFRKVRHNLILRGIEFYGIIENPISALHIVSSMGTSTADDE